MKWNSPKFEVVRDVAGEPLIIRDVGPWEEHLSVTNGAEETVEVLVSGGLLPPGRRLFYYDSDGQLDELLVRDGEFGGFRMVTAGEVAKLCGSERP